MCGIPGMDPQMAQKAMTALASQQSDMKATQAMATVPATMAAPPASPQQPSVASAFGPALSA